jgi:hypothetical protein
MSRAILPLPPNACMACSGTAFYFTTSMIRTFERNYLDLPQGQHIAYILLFNEFSVLLEENELIIP